MSSLFCFIFFFLQEPFSSNFLAVVKSPKPFLDAVLFYPHQLLRLLEAIFTKLLLKDFLRRSIVMLDFRQIKDFQRRTLRGGYISPLKPKILVMEFVISLSSCEVHPCCLCSAMLLCNVITPLAFMFAFEEADCLLQCTYFTLLLEGDDSFLEVHV